LTKSSASRVSGEITGELDRCTPFEKSVFPLFSSIFTKHTCVYVIWAITSLLSTFTQHSAFLSGQIDLNMYTFLSVGSDSGERMWEKITPPSRKASQSVPFYILWLSKLCSPHFVVFRPFCRSHRRKISVNSGDLNDLPVSVSAFWDGMLRVKKTWLVGLSADSAQNVSICRVIRGVS